MILHDCSLHGPDVDNELFVVEGLSAANNVLRARDVKTQAVYALQGKPVNAAKVSRSRLEKHTELHALAAALGCGLGVEFELEALRYERIVLLFDPDADGIHASALVQIFFQQLMPKLIQAQKLVLVRAPLFEISTASSSDSILTYSEQHYNKVSEYLINTRQEKYQSTRFKGVASLSVELLKSSCLSLVTRKAQVLSSEDTLMALEVFG